jgi:hypothetical protein
MRKRKLIMRRGYHAASLVDYGAVPTSSSARFHQPPFKPYVRFSRIRLNDDLLDVACVVSDALFIPAFHWGVTPGVTAFADIRRSRTHLAHIDSRTAELSRFN